MSKLIKEIIMCWSSILYRYNYLQTVHALQMTVLYKNSNIDKLDKFLNKDA